MFSFKKFVSYLSAIVMIGMLNTYTASATEEKSDDPLEIYTYNHWFGSGYRRYEDGIGYDIEIRRNGEVYVTASCNKPYTPEELEGDFIKFGSIVYDNSIYDMEYSYEEYGNCGYMYTEDAVSGSTTTNTFWCKHATFGIESDYVFELWLHPVKENFTTKVTIIDKSFEVKDKYNTTATTSVAPESTTTEDIKDAPITAPAVMTTTSKVTTVTTTTTTTIATTVIDIVKNAPVTAPTNTTVVDLHDSSHTPLNKETTVTVPAKIDLDFIISTESTSVTTEATTSKPESKATTAEPETTVLTTTTTTVVSGDKDYTVFDVNNDGYVNFQDIVSILNFLFNK